MLEEASIKRQLQRDKAFVPPYCPNPKCKHHRGSEERFWSSNGSKAIGRFPYLTRRLICRSCRKTFSPSFFRLDYRQKIWGLNRHIFENQRKGTSMREIGRDLGKGEDFVRYRIVRMSRWALLQHAKKIEAIQIEEPIVYDGLENFSYSQYDPNNINHAVGKKSLFTYDFNFSPLNRKGRMSGRQRKKKRLLENAHGSYPKDAIRSSTGRIFARLLSKSRDRLTLYSDRHFQYQRAIEEDLKTKRIEHIRVSSKIARNFRNDLFAVNNIDCRLGIIYRRSSVRQSLSPNTPSPCRRALPFTCSIATTCGPNSGENTSGTWKRTGAHRRCI